MTRILFFNKMKDLQPNQDFVLSGILQNKESNKSNLFPYEYTKTGNC